MAGDESTDEIVSGFVQGLILGCARVISEIGRRPKNHVLAHDDIIVERVTKPTQKELEQALDLLEHEDRIAPDERRPRDEMIRFVRESSETHWFRRSPFRDYLFVARTGDQVDAMAFFTHYVRDRMSAVSYFVARRGSARKQGRLSRASVAMAEALAKFHYSLRPKVHLILAEVDDPRLTASPPERNRRCARLDIFSQLADIHGRRLRVLDFAYMQPSLDPAGKDGERQMLLVFVPLRAKFSGDNVERSAVGDLLAWLYTRVYADAYLTNPTLDKTYRRYLEELRVRQLGLLPDSVSCSDAKAWVTTVRASSPHAA